MKKKKSGSKKALEAVKDEGGYAPEKYFVVDTSALLHAEDVFENLRANGKNCIGMPFATWNELDDHKKGSAHENYIARKIMRRFEELQESGDPSIKFLPYDFGHIQGLEKAKNDHRIIAAALYAKKNFGEKAPVILVSKDTNIRVLARYFGIAVEDVKRGQVKIDSSFERMAELNVPREIIKDGCFPFNPSDEKQRAVPENGGAVCYSNFDSDEWKKSFVAIRKGSRFEIVERGINLYGIYPKSNNGEINWAQQYAMAVLRDQEISLVALSGEAGTAKTFLAILAAFHQKSQYKQILISRVPVWLGNKDRLGYSPGGIDEKLKPWLLPIYDNIDVIKTYSGKKDEIENMMRNEKVEILDLDKIRGRSIQNRFIIVDEIQNLPPEQVLAIVTRAGEGTKIVLTGDYSLKQIDVPWLDEKSNGLSVLIKIMYGSKMFAAVHLDQAIRSPLVQEILNRWKNSNI